MLPLGLRIEKSAWLGEFGTALMTVEEQGVVDGVSLPESSLQK